MNATKLVDAAKLVLAKVPDLVKGISCPGRWNTLLSTQAVLAIALSGTAYATLASALWFACYLWLPPHQMQIRRDIKCLTLTVPAFLALPLGILVPQHVARRLRLRWHVSFPQHLQQVMQCGMHWVEPPHAILPRGCGTYLSREEQQHRLEYYLSALVLLMSASFLIGLVLTGLGRGLRAILLGCRARSREVSRPCEYDRVPDDSTSEPEREAGWQVTCYAGAFHIFCASLSLLAMATGRLDDGLCWEFWLLWAIIVLSISLVQCLYFTVFLPTGALVPIFALPMVTPLLPILGEPLDTFKDWLFVGLAMSRRIRHLLSKAL